MTGPWWNWDSNGGPIATWHGFWDPRDAQDLGTGGFFHVQFDPIPTEEMQYLWVINGETELGETFWPVMTLAVFHIQTTTAMLRRYGSRRIVILKTMNVFFADMYGIQVGWMMKNQKSQKSLLAQL